MFASKKSSVCFWSMVAVAGVMLLLNSVLNWHAAVTLQQPRHHRWLLDEAPKFDDDVTRDETCRNYIMQFLNGTTDAKDECQGFYNAYQAADCKDEGQKSDDGYLGRTHRLDNGTVVDDDVVMDDEYETWECCYTITQFYNKNCQQESVLDSVKLLGIVLVLVICGLVKSLIRVAGVQWIPDAGACIVVGSIVGGLLRVINPEVVHQKLTFDNDLFLGILLPPIIFEAAISIDKKAFRRDLFAILTNAIFGTFFSAVAIGWITYRLSAMGTGTALPLLDSLLFGALASSIDPVATLGILSNVGVSQADTLYTLIFGESLLNDGVSIVLFESLVNQMGDSDVVDQATVQDTISHFLLVTTGSMLVGCVCGALCTLYFWALQGKNTAVTEVAVFFSWALIPYYIADGIGASGIIAIMVMGFMLDYFVIGGHQSDEGEWMDYMERRCPPHPSQDGLQVHHPVEPCMARFNEVCRQAFSGHGHLLRKSRNHVGFVAEVISSIMETAIFAYLGLFLFNSDHAVNMKLTSTGIFACMSSRAAQVIIFSLLINIAIWMDLEGKLGRLFRALRQRDSSTMFDNDDDDSYRDDTKVYLDAKTQLILFSAGVRGAVSFALVQNIPVYDAVTKHGSHYKAELKAMTSATIVVILFVFGALTYFTVQRDMNPRNPDAGTPGTLRQRLLQRQSVLASEDGLSDAEMEDEEARSFFDPQTPSLEIDGSYTPSRRHGI